MKNLFALIPALGASLLLTQNSDAGQKYGMTANCSVSNNVPNCYGSLRGANQSSGASDYSEFSLSQSGTLYFAARVGSNTYSCSWDATTSARLAPAIMTMNYNLYYNLKIDGSGRCTNASFTSSSVYQHLTLP
jgi:hypothetical protein